MNKTRKHKGVYLLVAFSIAWISFFSILNFHMHKICGEYLIGQTEFVKSSQKNSIKDNANFSYKVDLNSGDFVILEFDQLPELTFVADNYHIQLVKRDSQSCLSTPILRGPPQV